MSSTSPDTADPGDLDPDQPRPALDEPPTAEPATRSTGATRVDRARPSRVAPSVPVAAAVFVAYVIVFIGLAGSSGIGYLDWFSTGPNAFRAAVLPLAAGSLVLVAFLWWARWDHVFHDPERLPMTTGMKVALVLFTVGAAAQFAVADWGATTASLLLAILAAGVLVGFAEETLFRGIILRSLRTGVRPEAKVLVLSSLWFGFFHLTNIATGSNPVSVLAQCILATCNGVILYGFRRARGVLVLAMVAHGTWDASAFLPAPSGSLANVSRIVMVVVLVASVVAAVSVIRRERAVAVTERGTRRL